MEFVDSHCHLQFDKYDDPAEVVKEAKEAGVTRMICVGTTLEDSHRAIELAGNLEGVWPTAGHHPHAATDFLNQQDSVIQFSGLIKEPSIIAIGGVGLDYYKNYSPRDDQLKALRLQIEAGSDADLPFIFHVRDAW